jgi:hypothetical protein
LNWTEVIISSIVNDESERLGWIMDDPRATSSGAFILLECLSLSTYDVGATNEIRTLALFARAAPGSEYMLDPPASVN